MRGVDFEIEKYYGSKSSSSWIPNWCYSDHPHGGGEGRCPVGRPQPMTPWGKPALGRKTRARKKYSDSLILRRRKVS